MKNKSIVNTKNSAHIDYKEIKLDAQKHIQIDILKYVVDFCVKNNINYWLDRGTLLGAIRHKGYIPWDDDIDIGMLRNDYDLFIRSFSDSSGNYVLKCVEIDPLFPCAFTKIIDTRTLLYEPDINGIALGVFIDVIPLDNIPPNPVAVRRIYRKRNLMKLLSALQANLVRPKTKHRIIMANVLHTVLTLFPENYFVRSITHLRIKNSRIDSSFIGDYTCVDNILAEKEWFSGFVKKEFEGDLYNVPIGYDSYLRNIYGDNYLSLPPVDERKTDHSYVALYR